MEKEEKETLACCVEVSSLENVALLA